MPIQFTCSNCGKHYRISKDYAGKSAKCTECGQAIHIPPAATMPVIEVVEPDIAESSSPPAGNSGSSVMIAVLVLLLLAIGGGAFYWFVLRDPGGSEKTDGGGPAVAGKLSPAQRELAELLNRTIWRSADGTHPSMQFDVKPDGSVTGSFTTAHLGRETVSGVFEDGRVVGDNRIEFRFRQQDGQGVRGTGQGPGVLTCLGGGRGFRVEFTTSDGRKWLHPLQKVKDRTPTVSPGDRQSGSGFAPSRILTETLASFRRAVAANNAPAATALFHRKGPLKDAVGTFMDYTVTASELGSRMVKAYGEGVFKQPAWSEVARFYRLRDPANWRRVQFVIVGDRARTRGTPTANPLELVLVDGVWLIDPNKSFPVPAGQIDSAVASYARTTRAMKKILPLIGKNGHTPASLAEEFRKEH